VIFVDEAAEHIATPDRVSATVRRTLLPRQGNAQREAAVRSLLVVVADADAQQHRLTRRLVAHGVVERNFEWCSAWNA
jgi:hypothetical protein